MIVDSYKKRNSNPYIVILFGLMFSIAFLSSEMAYRLGLSSFRIYGLSILVVLLVISSIALRPVFSRHLRIGPIILLINLYLIALLDTRGNVDILDYKILLPILIIMFSSNIANHITFETIFKTAFVLLTVYLITIAANLLYFGVGEFVALGEFYNTIIRVKVTGSLTTQAYFSIFYIVLCISLFWYRTTMVWRSGLIAASSLALIMIFQTAIRGVILVFVLYLMFSIFLSTERIRQSKRFLFILSSLATVFVGYTVFYDDSYFLRIISYEGQVSYTTSRWPSIVYWLGEVKDDLLGLGFGYIRENTLDPDYQLTAGPADWPHNEFVRFYVDAGLLGLSLISLLVGYMIVNGLMVARRDPNPIRKEVCMFIVADLIIECMLLNYFNDPYRATVFLLILGIGIVEAKRESYKALAVGDAAPEGRFRGATFNPTTPRRKLLSRR